MQFKLNYCLLGIVMALAVLATDLVAVGQESSLKVMTYNIRYLNKGDGDDIWDNRKVKVAETIALADIVGLQEVVFEQLTFLESQLKGFQWVGVGRDDGKRGGEYSPIFFRADKFELVDSGTFWLSETPDQIGSRGWDAALPRVVTWASLKSKQSGSEFVFFNTHFDHRGSKAREQSSILLRQKVTEIAGEKPVVVTGDFNANPSAAPIQTMLAETLPGENATGKAQADLKAQSDLIPLREVTLCGEVKSTGPTGTWNAFKEIAEGSRIDFIFISTRWKLQQCETLDPRTESGRFASDHLPVFASITL